MDAMLYCHQFSVDYMKLNGKYLLRNLIFYSHDWLLILMNMNVNQLTTYRHDVEFEISALDDLHIR